MNSFPGAPQSPRTPGRQPESPRRPPLHPSIPLTPRSSTTRKYVDTYMRLRFHVNLGSLLDPALAIGTGEIHPPKRK